MTELTREQVAALVGRWDRACRIGGITASASIRADLDAAAPDLARQLLAAMDQLADAEMAQAALVERAVEFARIRAEQYADMALNGLPENARLREAMEAAFIDLRWAIRRLAPDAGVKALAELRAERDALAATVQGLRAGTVNIVVAEGQVKDELRADRDRLAAKLAERAIYPCSYDVPDNLTYDEAQIFRAGAEAAIDAVAAALRGKETT